MHNTQPVMKEADWIKSVTRGGQVFLHNFRMINQVLNKLLLWSLLVWIMVSLLWFLSITPAYEYYLTIQWLWAKFYVLIGNPHQILMITQPDHRVLPLDATTVANAAVMDKVLAIVLHKGINSLVAGFIAYLICVGLAMKYLKRHGEQQSKARYIKGDYLDAVEAVHKKMRQAGRVSDLTLGANALPVPVYAEMQHFLFHGTTGTGKSNAIKELLDYIRRRGDRAIVYDKSCNLVKQFYLPEHDHLLNPLDKRSLDWNLWKECRDKADFENIAAAIIPMPASSQDPFWVNAARTIFAAAAYRMRKQENPSLLELLRSLLTADIQELQALLQGTEAETLMSEKTEKTAISIKSVLATYLKSLCYVKDGDTAFSIREWIKNDYGHAWLFISSLGDKHEALKPLITAWLDIAVNTLLSLPENRDRRIWLILDELASLQQLPYLSFALSEARKFGGCFIIGIQSYAQLAKLYGDRGAQEISSLLNTRIMFRIPDPEIARWSAHNLGETVIEEVREGISYGANTMRDGVSVNRVELKKPVVEPAEIQRLADLTAYVRLPGEYPIVKLPFAYVARRDVGMPFDARDYEQEDLRKEVMKLVEENAQSAPSAATAAVATVANPDNPETKEQKKAKSKKAAKTNQKPAEMALFDE